MMEFKIIEIASDKYVVASEVNLNGVIFVYLVNLEDNSKVMFARLDDENTISRIEDADIIDTLVPLFIEKQKYVDVS